MVGGGGDKATMQAPPEAVVARWNDAAHATVGIDPVGRRRPHPHNPCTGIAPPPPRRTAPGPAACIIKSKNDLLHPNQYRSFGDVQAN